MHIAHVSTRYVHCTSTSTVSNPFALGELVKNRVRTFNHCFDNEYSVVAELTNLTAESRNAAIGKVGSVLSSLATRTLNTVIGALMQ
jgi:hypothetical protein